MLYAVLNVQVHICALHLMNNYANDVNDDISKPTQNKF